MSRKIYVAAYAIACPGGKTVAAGKPIQLTDEQAERLLAKGAVTLVPEEAVGNVITGELFALPDAEFEAALADMKLAALKATAESLALELGEAKTKADYAALITAARAAAQAPGA